MPVLGTCAGMIVLASRADDQEGLLGGIDISVRRNAYGRQTESFEADVEVRGTGTVRAVFIRAPIVEDRRLRRHGARRARGPAGRPGAGQRPRRVVPSGARGETALHARLLERV
jgi:hypothetical protein